VFSKLFSCLPAEHTDFDAACPAIDERCSVLRRAVCTSIRPHFPCLSRGSMALRRSAHNPF
jgi:hypothetical protein